VARLAIAKSFLSDYAKLQKPVQSLVESAMAKIKGRLKAAGVQAASLAASGKRDTVRVGTMHGMKGLEFQAVAVVDVADGAVPAPSAVTPETADPVAHALDLQRERCVLFVACTRVRDHLYVSYSGAPSPFLE
jgi:superfamily I DNA/RNA helicase